MIWTECLCTMIPAEHHKHLRTTNPIDLCLGQTENWRNEALEVVALGSLSDLSDRQASGKEFAAAQPCREVKVHQLAEQVEPSNSVGGMR